MQSTQPWSGLGTRTVHKYQGTGNDFVILDERPHGVKAAPPPTALAAALCDRHFGVGADGVLTVLPAAGRAQARMHITNADGSVPEMCGNGLRCVALYLSEHDGLPGSTRLVVETDAGVRTCDVDRHASGEGAVKLSMGQVRLGAAAGLPDVTRWDVAGQRVRALAVSVGNPHLVLDLAAPRTEEAEEQGRMLVRATGFPQGTNVEWLAHDGGRLDVLVYERGVGLTLACGTGAVASVFAAEHWGLVKLDDERGVPVHLPGGELVIGRSGDGEAWLRGGAHRVFTAELG